MKWKNERADVLQHAAESQAQFSYALQQLGGYTTKTTYYADLTTADTFGVNGVKDTYNRVYNEWRDNPQKWSEFTMCLNHKLWEHYDEHPNDPLTELYDKLWKQADAYALDNYKGDALNYYLNITD